MKRKKLNFAKILAFALFFGLMSLSTLVVAKALNERGATACSNTPTDYYAYFNYETCIHCGLCADIASPWILIIGDVVPYFYDANERKKYSGMYLEEESLNVISEASQACPTESLIIL